MKKASNQATMELSHTADISVIIAYFNGMDCIHRALDSISAQTLPPKEVIVVDDGSSEEHANYLDSLAEKYQLTIIRQGNAGQSAARNLGVQNATGDFVCFLDQDDYYLSQHNEQLRRSVPEGQKEFGYSFGDVWRVTEAGIVIATSVTELERPQPYSQLWQMVRGNMNILPSATLINRKAFLEVGGFDVQFRGYEDDDLFLRFFLSGYSRVFVREPVSAWTLNTSSTSFTEAMSVSRYKYYRKLHSFFKINNIPGYRVFADLLAPRFAHEFLAEVVRAAFEKSPHYIEKQMRLREFAADFADSTDFRGIMKLKFIFASYCLSRLSPTSLTVLLRLAYPFMGLAEKAGFRGAKELLTRYL